MGLIMLFVFKMRAFGSILLIAAAVAIAGCAAGSNQELKDPCRDEYESCTRRVALDEKKCLADGGSEKECGQSLQEARSVCDTLREDCLANAIRLGTQVK